MGRRFVAAEFVGAFFLIGIMWLIVRMTLRPGLEAQARRHAEAAGGMGSMQGGGKDDPRPLGKQLRDPACWRKAGTAFWSDVEMVWKEVLGGFVVAGLLMTLVPAAWWQALFLSRAPAGVRLVENAVAGPLIAMASFVCSVGNLPLASWLWSNGIGFGGVVAFIFGDLIIVPLLLIYRKYYGGKAAAYVAAVLFASMVMAGIAVDLLFSALGLVPHGPRLPSAIPAAHFAWDYTTWLDLGALAVAGGLYALRKRAAGARSTGDGGC